MWRGDGTPKNSLVHIALSSGAQERVMDEFEFEVTLAQEHYILKTPPAGE